MEDQQRFLRQAMRALQLTRDEFAKRFGLTRRALDTWLLPLASSEFRSIPETARRYITEVLWLYVEQRLTYTRSVHSSSRRRSKMRWAVWRCFFRNS